MQKVWKNSTKKVNLVRWLNKTAMISGSFCFPAECNKLCVKLRPIMVWINLNEQERKENTSKKKYNCFSHGVIREGNKTTRLVFLF